MRFGGLELLLSGALILSPISALAQQNQKEIIFHRGKVGITESYEKLDQIMDNTISKYGKKFVDHGCCLLEFEDGIVDTLNLDMEYLRGPRGGSGRLRVLTYLGGSSRNTLRGINDIDIFLLSTNRTRVVKEMYETNLNKNLGCVTHMPTEYRKFEYGDMAFEKVEGLLYSAANSVKIFRIKKKHIKKMLELWGLVEEYMDYQTMQKIIEIGNLITGDHVWVTLLHYDGYGFWDIDAELRAPKLVEWIIKEGEASVKGFAMRGRGRGYREAKVWKGDFASRRQFSTVDYDIFPLDMEKAIREITGREPAIEEEWQEQEPEETEEEDY